MMLYSYQNSYPYIQSIHQNSYLYIQSTHLYMHQCKILNMSMNIHSHILLFLVAWHLK